MEAKKLRILLIVQPERIDWYYYLKDAPGIEWHLLWYEKPGQMIAMEDQLPLTFSQIHYWTDFVTPANLIRSINPDRIVFFEVIDLRQIALLVAAKNKKIPTFYLEHGAAGDKETAILRAHEISFYENKLPYLLKRLITGFGDIIKSKIFYFSLVKGFHSLRSYFKYLGLPFKMMRSGSGTVLSKNVFIERTPDKAIVFNKSNYESFALYTGIDVTDAVYTGVPLFDKYYNSNECTGEHIVYIDHPYLEESIIGWTAKHHRMVAQALFKFAEKNKIKLYIKLHPRSDKSIWENYNYNKEFVEIVQHGDFMELYLLAKLILGFSSSLINGFLCAKKNVVLLGWHPEPSIFGADFSKTGLCHYSFYPDDLEKKFDYWSTNNLSLINEIKYQEFLKEFNHPFDGKAGERVISTIISG